MGQFTVVGSAAHTSIFMQLYKNKNNKKPHQKPSSSGKMHIEYGHKTHDHTLELLKKACFEPSLHTSVLAAWAAPYAAAILSRFSFLALSWSTMGSG
jgi:hypothetical protein